MADQKQKLYGICRTLGRCVDNLCDKIDLKDNEYSLPDLPQESISILPLNIRKPRIPQFCKLNVNPNKIGWYTE